MNAPDDRDRAIERLLRSSLKTPRPDASGSCLDPEMLAAWVDGGLSGAELEIAQSHVAGCARCQAVVGMLVQVSREDVKALPVGSERPEPARRRWLGWLVPLTAAAAVIAIWVAVPRAPATSEPGKSARESGRAFQATAPAAQATNTQPPSPALRQEQAAAAHKSDQPVRDQAQASALSKDADRRELDRLKQESQFADAPTERADKPRAAAEASPAAPAAPPPAASDGRQALQERSGYSAAAKAAPGGAVASLALPARWRITGTTLEHSTNGGSTWRPVATGVTSELTAVSSPSETVCWVVGQRGVVLTTTDGQRFSRVAFPEIADLSAVQAADARSARVTTSDGRVFTTEDGGASWQRR